MPFEAEAVASARRHLRRKDPVMRRLIDVVGPFTLKARRDRFRMLVRSIISQQISGKPARSIGQRLEALVAPAKTTPPPLPALSVADFRSLPVSPQQPCY